MTNITILSCISVQVCIEPPTDGDAGTAASRGVIALNNNVKLSCVSVQVYFNPQQMAMLEELRREASWTRMPVSESVGQIKAYVTQHQQEDYLLIGFSSQKANPYREKSSCDIL